MTLPQRPSVKRPPAPFFSGAPVSDEKGQAVAMAVRAAHGIPSDAHHSRLARPEDATAFLDFLSDPAVHAPIYTLPSPLTLESVTHFIFRHIAERDLGHGLLFLNWTEAGTIAGYNDICIWPDYAAGELGGAVHPERQGKGMGLAGARICFDWMFDRLGLDIIYETAAPDNIRTARLLDSLGFQRRGEIESTRDDGSVRASLLWEVTRAGWRNG